MHAVDKTDVCVQVLLLLFHAQLHHQWHACVQKGKMLCLVEGMILFCFQHMTDRVSGYVHAYTLHSAVRPFGTSMIVASYGSDGPEMFLIEPSGVSWVSLILPSSEGYNDNVYFYKTAFF